MEETRRPYLAESWARSSILNTAATGGRKRKGEEEENTAKKMSGMSGMPGMAASPGGLTTRPFMSDLSTAKPPSAHLTANTLLSSSLTVNRLLNTGFSNKPMSTGFLNKPMGTGFSNKPMSTGHIKPMSTSQTNPRSSIYENKMLTASSMSYMTMAITSAYISPMVTTDENRTKRRPTTVTTSMTLEDKDALKNITANLESLSETGLLLDMEEDEEEEEEVVFPTYNSFKVEETKEKPEETTAELRKAERVALDAEKVSCFGSYLETLL